MPKTMLQGQTKHGGWRDRPSWDSNPQPFPGHPEMIGGERATIAPKGQLEIARDRHTNYVVSVFVEDDLLVIVTTLHEACLTR